ncbi:hypothetical protein CBS147332_2930 [Penicillium roqueforti]|nr:hypothetical protein CBS147355_1690 [Penicillium roqueforti]KAI2726043.1 hypothetical protein CBS147332_2930 [Penicillium roqueforti]KAI2731621.1 hypothetical protein CBS147354_730 [Penicillium roqueforti]KAI3125326.1 hypothetical protein CBS147331_320 [Penicillium roqueforti]
MAIELGLFAKTALASRFTDWAKQYGPVFPLRIGSHGLMVVLTSAYHATHLLDKRSANSSNRPPSFVLGDLVFAGDHPMFMDANERWKLRRKLYFQLMNEARCNTEHIRLVEAEATHLLRDLCLEPDSFMQHPARYSNSIIMSLVFGIRTPHYSSPHCIELQRIVTELSNLGEIGASPPVDWLPFLKYLPERLWGNWKTRAARLRQRVLNLHSPLVDRVLERRKNIGTAATFLDGVLDRQEKLQLTREEIDIMCGNLLEGGTDTMATTILTFFQAMVTYPEVQARAQKQIDSVLTDGECPSWSDYDRLPYVAMIVKEVLRWRPPAPGSFPHTLAQDDEFEGMKFLKGTSVVLNVWGIHNDESRYPSPETFEPSRFAEQTRLASVYANAGDAQKRDHFGYGAGRRICPGIHLAERALFIAMAKLLWGFTVQQKLDSSGNPIPVDVNPATAYRDGFLNQCLPFDIDIKPRLGRQEMIMVAAAKAENDVLSAYE